ncbi:MAG: SBBP repeat-containing protein [Candidatus Thorarchaeota archaeon]
MNRIIKREYVLYFLFCFLLLILASFNTIDLVSSNFNMSQLLGNPNQRNYSIFSNYQNNVGINWSFSTYYGGSGDDKIIDLAIDSENNIILIGYTNSIDFPIVNAFQNSLSGVIDIFVVKLDSSGQNILFASYLGGNSMDNPQSIFIDSEDNIYITGTTFSDNFPLSNAVQTIRSGFNDGFVTKISPSGTILYSTLLGGNSTEYVTGLDFDKENNFLIGGQTSSSDFTITTDAYDSSYSGSGDCFLTFLSSDGQEILYSSFFGGSTSDSINCGFINQNNEIVIAGFTFSTDFNITDDAYQYDKPGSSDMFISIFNSTGQELLYSSYFGGNWYDMVQDIKEDSLGNLILAGWTQSTNFPLGPNPIKSQYDDKEDAFVAKFNAEDNTLIFSTYLGGIGYDWATGITIDSDDNIFISGTTSSSAYNVTSNAYQPFIGGERDLFFTILPPDGQSLLYSTFLGGSNNDFGYRVNFDSENNFILYGHTSSSDFPTTNAYQNSFAGIYDGFICKFTFSEGTKKTTLSNEGILLFTAIVCISTIISRKRK